MKHYFAPGVIEASPRKRQAQELLRWSLRCVGLMASVAVVGFAVRYWS
jgi:hypothetical protein